MNNKVIVIGGGPAGLLTAYHLKQFGLSSLILEKKQPGQSWREMKDGMVMLSPAVAQHDLTSLTFRNPIWSAVKLQGAFATKEEFLQYLDIFIRENKLSIKSNSAVSKISPIEGGFSVHTEEGKKYEAPVVVVATGVISNPHIPNIPGVRGNDRVIHSREYGSFEGYRGRRVLIVGAGNSGAELTVELSGICKLTLATKSRLKFYSRTKDLSHIRGLSESLLKELISFKIIDLMEKVEVEEIKGGTVLFSDGREKEFDKIIFATGYRPYLPDFESIPLKISKSGYPIVTSTCESKSVKGIYFTGPLAHTNRYCSFIHCFRPMVEPMALHIAESFGN
ncbi:MAG: NAD(P)-binding domain-containing protein [Deltaproteobacteria bacterium]|nr:NAD(P)-binding domain-containing protein [Deltaproteobacteria bacterium]